MNKEDSPPDPEGSEPESRGAPLRIDSTSLIGAARELIIEHNGREYRLRLTQNGKLILTA